MILERRIAYPRSPGDKYEAQEQLKTLLAKRKFLVDTTVSIVEAATAGNKGLMNSVFNSNNDLTNFDCFDDAAEAFHSKCFSLTCNDYAMRMVNYLAIMCEIGIPKDVIISAMDSTCNHEPVCGIY